MLRRFQTYLFGPPHPDVYAWIRLLMAPLALLASLAQYHRFGQAAPTALPSVFVWLCVLVSGVAEIMPARLKSIAIGLRLSAVIAGICCLPWMIAALVILMQM